uniref:Uncharacterized protein n=1 Tax=Anopheles coluzzii TaxID=1518534 RepID=A0A8W7PZH6_ANOCL
MKTIVAFALFITCVAHIHCFSYPSCGGNVFYTEEHPSGYLEEVVYNYPYPYRCAGVNHGYGDCKCPRCSPRLFTQQHVPCNTYH